MFLVRSYSIKVTSHQLNILIVIAKVLMEMRYQPPAGHSENEAVCAALSVGAMLGRFVLLRLAACQVCSTMRTIFLPKLLPRNIEINAVGAFRRPSVTSS